MTPEQRERLRKTAEGASRENWSFEPEPPHVTAVRRHGGSMVAHVVGDSAQTEADAEFIAAFDPPTALALLDRIDALEAGVRRIAHLQDGWNKPHKPTTARQMIDDAEAIARALLQEKPE